MSEKNMPEILRQGKGAATVEFAFALIALFGFFAIFMQFVLFFIAEERLSFAGFAAARTYAVKGNGPAIQTAVSIEPRAAIELNGRLVLTRDIPLPAGMARFLTGGERRLTVSHASPLFREPDYKDDNPDPF